jgi:pantoate--beta-alanine ligase
MGYLHQGLLALVQRAAAENDRVAVSIYVNPTQFNAAGDLAAYPRDLERDLHRLRNAGVDLVFTPADAVMYPAGFQTAIQVRDVARRLEGAARPGHFDGVATVVAKLFNIFQPDRAYFGQKDAQQTVVIRRLVTDLNLPVSIVIVPTVRDADGLALSSRNARLTPAQRAAAPLLFRALQAAADLQRAGERRAGALRDLMTATVAAEPLARLDYASVADPLSLRELDQIEGPLLLSLAVYFDQIRLIDNLLLEKPNA